MMPNSAFCYLDSTFTLSIACAFLKLLFQGWLELLSSQAGAEALYCKERYGEGKTKFS
jgi:hypothetical protein